MDQYPTSGPGSQPEPPAPNQPTQPPQGQPYQPPAGQPYQPPQGQPYQQPGQPPQGQPGMQPGGEQYYQAPPPPQEKPKKGFNWLMCCGITCGCLVILAIIGGIGAFVMFKNFAEWGTAFDEAAEAVNAADVEQIRAEARIVDSNVLVQSPELYTDQWIAVEGIISGDVSSTTSFNMGQYGTQNTTTYYLEGGVLVMDLSQRPQVGYNGDMIRAYGKAVVFDMSTLPMFGQIIEKAMEEAAKEDPTIQDVPMKMVMVYTRDVELVTTPSDQGEDENGGAEPPWEQPKW